MPFDLKGGLSPIGQALGYDVDQIVVLVFELAEGAAPPEGRVRAEWILSLADTKDLSRPETPIKSAVERELSAGDFGEGLPVPEPFVAFDAQYPVPVIDLPEFAGSEWTCERRESAGGGQYVYLMDGQIFWNPSVLDIRPFQLRDNRPFRLNVFELDDKFLDAEERKTRGFRHYSDRTRLPWLNVAYYGPNEQLISYRLPLLLELSGEGGRRMAYAIFDSSNDDMRMREDRAAYTRYLPEDQGGPPLF